jgi:hypothetical protein
VKNAQKGSGKTLFRIENKMGYDWEKLDCVGCRDIFQFGFTNNTSSIQTVTLFDSLLESITEQFPVVNNNLGTVTTAFASNHQNSLYVDDVQTIYANDLFGFQTRLNAIDVNTNNVVASILLPSLGSKPAYSSTLKRLYVGVGNDLYTIDVLTNTVINTQTFGATVQALGVIDEYGKLYFRQGTSISVYDINTATVTGTIGTGGWTPRQMVYDPVTDIMTVNENMGASARYSFYLATTDTLQNQIVATARANGGGTLLSRKIYFPLLGTPQVDVVDIDSQTLLPTLATVGNPLSTTGNVQDEVLYVSDPSGFASIFDATTDTLIQNLPMTITTPRTIDYVPFLQTVYVGDGSSANYNTFYSGNSVTFDNPDGYDFFNNQLRDNPVTVNCMEVISDDQQQLFQMLTYQHLDATGKQTKMPILPSNSFSKDQFQGNRTLMNFGERGMIIDGNNSLPQYRLLPNQSVTMLLYYDQLEKADFLTNPNQSVEEAIDMARTMEMQTLPPTITPPFSTLIKLNRQYGNNRTCRPKRQSTEGTTNTEITDVQCVSRSL